MAVKCDMCGKMTNKYHTTSSGDTVCYGTCLAIYRLESYLLTMEERREHDEPNNLTAYQQARELSAWLSLWKFGNTEQKKSAEKVIRSWDKGGQP